MRLIGTGVTLLTVTACKPGLPVITLVDANNYALSGSLDIQSTEVREQSDITFNWAHLNTDLLGHSLDPIADIDQVALAAFPGLSQTEVEIGLSENTLLQSDVGLYIWADPGDATSEDLSALRMAGNNIGIVDQFKGEYGTWLLILASGTTPGQGARMLEFLAPSADSNTDSVEVTADSATLSVAADFSRLQAVSMPAGTDVVLDWSALTRDGRGNPLQQSGVDEIQISRYEGYSVSDLQDRFVDLDSLAAASWSHPATSATSVALTALLDDEDNAVDLQPGPTWLLALRCNTCVNPAPPFLTVLDVQ